MKKYLPITLLIILGIITRFLPHPPNFTAIGAVALFGGLYLPRRWSLALPILAMFLSDVVIGFYSLPIMASVYIGFILTVIIGQEISKRKNISKILGGTITASLIFFLLTNWAVWAFGTMYTHNLPGLMQCYYMALPFFRNSLAGDVFFIGVLVGGYEMIKLSVQARIAIRTI